MATVFRRSIIIDVLLLVAFALCVRPAGAQVRRVPDCNLAAKQWDNPLGYSGGWQLRRYQWHIINASLSTAAAEGVHRVTHAPRWLSALVVAVTPHAIGLATHRYAFDWRDQAFDTFTRTAPLALWSARTQPLAYTTFAAGYLAGACWASP